MRVPCLIPWLVFGLLFPGQIPNLSGQGVETLIHDVSAMADGSVTQARFEAQRQAASGGLPFRSYKKGDYRSFSGKYTPSELPEDKKGRFVYGLALLSDDGCNVTVRGSVIHGRLGQGQHLPSIVDSFHVLPLALAPGEPVDITVDYSNVIYVDDPKSPGFPDIDGCTLFLYLLPMGIAVDANRDGTIAFSGEARDTTSQDAPFRFWINDDNDGLPNSEGEVVDPSFPDHEDGVIQTARDLEDFTRLWLYFDAFQKEISEGTYSIVLKWKNTTGSPSIKVYQSTDTTGSDSYLREDGAALRQISGNDAQTIGTVSGATSLILPKALWSGSSGQDPTRCLLFEASQEGKGQLVLTIQKSDGSEIGEGPSVWLDLVNVRKMYERANATPDNIARPHDSTTTPAAPSTSYVLDPYNNQWEYPPLSWTESKDYIVFVHGWNTSYDSARTFFADTMFKRLWQRGYKGRFAALYWPTLVGLNTYNESEYRAWFYGESLKQYVHSLPGGYMKNLVAHSMGNIVSGSALRKGMSIANYALVNAAVPASCYDPNPALQQPYGNSPDNDPDQPTQALAYKNKLSIVNTNLINFYLATDDALDAWVANNSQYKPEVFAQVTGGDHAYKYFPGNPSGEKLFLTFLLSPSRNLQQMEESLAYAARSSTKAVGAEGNAQGSISVSINEASYGYQDEHSGFWKFTLQRMKPAYDRLMDELGVGRNQ
jgi:pimeloyl-ACP methyl ester carboxylesterase